jgi:molecular chaperone GrpE
MTDQTDPAPLEGSEPVAAEAGTGAADAATAARVSQLEAELAQAKDDVLRALAEAENVRRRSAKEVGDARTYAIERFARDLLPVADTLDRALAALTSDRRAGLDEAGRTFVEGMELTARSLADAFGRHGLRPIGTTGEGFDPNKHQAVAQIPSTHPAGHVAEVLQPGYILSDRTVRPAMVAVSLGQAAAEPPATPAPAAEGGDDGTPGERVDITA